MLENSGGWEIPAPFDEPLEGGDYTPAEKEPWLFPIGGFMDPMGSMAPILPLWLTPMDSGAEEEKDPNP